MLGRVTPLLDPLLDPLTSEVILGIPTWVDVTAVAIGALSGALLAVRHEFDINGTLMMAIVTGLGGGLIRDVLLQVGTPIALTSPWLLPTALVVGLVVVLFSRRMDSISTRLRSAILLSDAVFLGVYSIVGTAKASGAGLPGASCVLLGVLTGLGGGLLRDILINEQPEVLRPGAFVAMTSVAGCTFYVWAGHGRPPTLLVGVAAVLLIIAFRVVAIWRRWESPPARVLSSALSPSRLAASRLPVPRLTVRRARAAAAEDAPDPAAVVAPAAVTTPARRASRVRTVRRSAALRHAARRDGE